MKSIALCIGCHWIHLFSIFCKNKFYQKAKWSTIADLVLPHEIGLWPTASWRIVHREAFALLYGHQFKLLHTTFDNHYNDILMYLIQFKIIQVYSTSVLFSDTKHLSTRHTGEQWRIFCFCPVFLLTVSMFKQQVWDSFDSTHDPSPGDLNVGQLLLLSRSLWSTFLKSSNFQRSEHIQRRRRSIDGFFRERIRVATLKVVLMYLRHDLFGKWRGSVSRSMDWWIMHL